MVLFGRINNCVGERNQKYFIQFLVYVGVLAIYAITLVIISWVGECPECSKDVTIKQNRMYVFCLLIISSIKMIICLFFFSRLHCVILVLESAMFGMFDVAILVDQFQAILGDETVIERLQGGQHHHYHQKSRKTLTLLSQVCGKGHPVFWLLPCHNPPRYAFRKADRLIDHEV